MTLEERIDRIILAGEIELAGEAYLKLASHLKDGEAYQKTLAHIPKIIENMQFLEEMKPDKENAGFDNYSYYITGVNIDGESYAILSTVGRVEQKVYYDQNVFKGTPEEVFKEAKTSTDNKYSRLKEILKDYENSNWRQVGIALPEASATLYQ